MRVFLLVSHFVFPFFPLLLPFFPPLFSKAERGGGSRDDAPGRVCLLLLLLLRRLFQAAGYFITQSLVVFETWYVAGCFWAFLHDCGIFTYMSVYDLIGRWWW